jgi:hypothetical protein
LRNLAIIPQERTSVSRPPSLSNQTVRRPDSIKGGSPHELGEEAPKS